MKLLCTRFFFFFLKKHVFQMDSHFSSRHLRIAQLREVRPKNAADFGEKLGNVPSLLVFTISLSIPLALSSSPYPSLTTVRKRK